MSYELDFLEEALEEWRGLDPSVRQLLKKKLTERCQNPRIPKSRLSGHRDCYKIKLKRGGWRLVYRVEDEALVVLVVAVGKRERSAAYKKMRERLEG